MNVEKIKIEEKEVNLLVLSYLIEIVKLLDTIKKINQEMLEADEEKTEKLTKEVEVFMKLLYDAQSVADNLVIYLGAAKICKKFNIKQDEALLSNLNKKAKMILNKIEKQALVLSKEEN